MMSHASEKEHSSEIGSNRSARENLVKDLLDDDEDAASSQEEVIGENVRLQSDAMMKKIDDECREEQLNDERELAKRIREAQKELDSEEEAGIAQDDKK